MGTTIHHVAIVVEDLDQALTFYRDTLGLDMTGRQEVPDEGVETAFFRTGEGKIELVRPLEADSGVARFLRKRGEGLHHLCLHVGDIDAVVARLRAAGAQLLSERPQLREDGTRYIFIHPRSAHGVLLELYEVAR
ncbi:MAG: methylmalonyl-CoA epimerase [Anaerolineae bacterium]|jgi:methylmalonyl-CoA/ethylmalonyl-CoA epimerase